MRAAFFTFDGALGLTWLFGLGVVLARPVGAVFFFGWSPVVFGVVSWSSVPFSSLVCS